MKKTQVATTLGALALIGAVGIGSTFAYLSSLTGPVTNTFHVGQTNITIDETDYDGDSERDTENTYDNMTPGSSYVKDPVVYLEGNSVESYIFVKVTGIDGNAGKLSLEDSALGETASDTVKWIKVEGTGTDGIYRYYQPVANDTQTAIALPALFEGVLVADSVTEDTEFSQIIINGCAVQSGNLTTAEALAEAKRAANW